MRNDPLKQKSYELFLKSLIGVLIVVILLFYFFPDCSLSPPSSKKKVEMPVFVLEDIPPATQQTLPRKKTVLRKLPSQFIPIPTETEELPESLAVGEKPGRSEVYSGNAAPVVLEIPPRPILEVYPDTREVKCKGEIQLFILISTRGKVLEIQVLKNTTGKDECLKATLRAVRKTQWLPGKRNGMIEEMWVKKTFRFQ